MHVFLEPPSDVETASHSVEVLHKYLPEARARWASISAKRVTYTIRELNHWGLPCGSLPIAIVATPSRVLSATYASTQGSSKRGARVDSSCFSGLPSPADLFDSVEQAARQFPGSLSVEFHVKLGLPEKIIVSDELDGGTSTLITKIEVVQ